MIDGTPVLDIKPYIPDYDSVHTNQAVNQDETLPRYCTECRDINPLKHAHPDGSDIKTADWLTETQTLAVTFTSRAESQLLKFSGASDEELYRLEHFSTASEAKTAIIEVLKADPRSVYRKQNCEDNLYYFTVDKIHITCWFDGDLAEVLKVQPIALSKLKDSHG